MLAVDTSGSMERPDFLLKGNAIDRLTAVKAIAGEFIQGRQGDRVGLILFGQRAYLQTPLTFDRTTVRTMLHEAEIGIAGKETAIGDAIGLAIKRLQQRPQNSRVLILLTDGANTAGEVEPAQAAQLAKEAGLRIHTIGIGADRMEVPSFFGTQTVNPSADLDENMLRLIADTTGGSYFRARDTQSLEGVYEKIDALEPVQSDSRVFRPIDELFFWPLAMSYALLILLGARMGWLGLSVFPLPQVHRK
jgi:Ca-activated chloride channel family protein